MTIPLGIPNYPGITETTPAKAASFRLDANGNAVISGVKYNQAGKYAIGALVELMTPDGTTPIAMTTVIDSGYWSFTLNPILLTTGRYIVKFSYAGLVKGLPSAGDYELVNILSPAGSGLGLEAADVQGLLRETEVFISNGVEFDYSVAINATLVSFKNTGNVTISGIAVTEVDTFVSPFFTEGSFLALSPLEGTLDGEVYGFTTADTFSLVPGQTSILRLTGAFIAGAYKVQLIGQNLNLDGTCGLQIRIPTRLAADEIDAGRIRVEDDISIAGPNGGSYGTLINADGMFLQDTTGAFIITLKNQLSIDDDPVPGFFAGIAGWNMNSTSMIKEVAETSRIEIVADDTPHISVFGYTNGSFVENARMGNLDVGVDGIWGKVGGFGGTPANPVVALNDNGMEIISSNWGIVFDSNGVHGYNAGGVTFELNKGENLTYIAGYADEASMELELMKINFQSISWAQFAVFDDLIDESKRALVDPSTYKARVYRSQLDTGTSSVVSINPVPTAGGIGYTAGGEVAGVNAVPSGTGHNYVVGNILVITSGNGDATVRVTAVGSTYVGDVKSVVLVSPGSGGYTVSTGNVTSGGSGSGCTISITSITAADLLKLTSGSGDAVVKVLTTGAGGSIATISLISGGTSSYRTSIGNATLGGTGNGCTVEITSIGGSDTPNRVFGFVSKTYANITNVYAGTSTSVGVGYLTDTAQNWFTNENMNLTLIDSSSASFTVLSNTANTLVVSGTPAAGAYVLRDALPKYTVAFCSYEDSTQGGYGYVKMEVSFDGGANYQTFLDTKNNVDDTEGTMSIVNQGRSYVVRISLINDASGNSPFVYNFLCCTDPSPWRF
jgi:hypothetical protein